MLSASQYFLQTGKSEWSEFDEYLSDQLDFVLNNYEMLFDVPKKKEVKKPMSWFFITLTVLKGEGWDVVQNLAGIAIDSSMFSIHKYVYCIEEGDDQHNNWHAHMLCLSSARNGKYNSIPVDKVRALKPFQDRRIHVAKLKKKDDYMRTLNYVVKNANKYPEIEKDLKSNIFANYELPFKDINIQYINDLQ